MAEGVSRWLAGAHADVGAGGSRRIARRSRRLDALSNFPNMIVSAQACVCNQQHREMAMTYQHILYDVSEKIATITLNRPDRMNAWTPIMERDVRHAMGTAATDDNVRV